jgi:hypothetical protein
MLRARIHTTQRFQPAAGTFTAVAHGELDPGNDELMQNPGPRRHLAAEVGALLIVSEDNDLTSMSPSRGVPILRAAEFSNRVGATRRHQRRGPH